LPQKKGKHRFRLRQTYETKDLILPMLKLEKPVTIRITGDDKYLRLFVGPRDWQFSKETGKSVGAGTRLGN